MTLSSGAVASSGCAAPVGKAAVAATVPPHTSRGLIVRGAGRSPTAASSRQSAHVGDLRPVRPVRRPLRRPRSGVRHPRGTGRTRRRDDGLLARRLRGAERAQPGDAPGVDGRGTRRRPRSHRRRRAARGPGDRDRALRHRRAPPRAERHRQPRASGSHVLRHDAHGDRVRLGSDRRPHGARARRPRVIPAEPRRGRAPGARGGPSSGRRVHAPGRDVEWSRTAKRARSS